MNDLLSYDVFSQNISNIKDVSKDDSNPKNIIYMSESLKEVIDFDQVKTLYTNDLGLSEEVANSFDALALDDEFFAFIEFKNGKMKNEKQSVKNKIRDSLLIFCDITKKDISFTRNNMVFILVYNGDKNPLPNQLQDESSSRVGIGRHMAQKAKKEFVLFDLKRFERLYFKKVHTYTTEQFKEYLKTLN